MIVYNSGDAGGKDDMFYVKRLTEEQVKKAEESYKMQEMTIQNGTTFDDLDSIKLNNSDAAPNYHMMSCIIQKSMSTVMSAIFCYLSREKEFISAGRNILREMSDIGLCQDENRFKTVDGMLQSLNIQNLSDWKFTMITREPVDRFLSGFIDRCLRSALQYTIRTLSTRPSTLCGCVFLVPQKAYQSIQGCYGTLPIGPLAAMNDKPLNGRRLRTSLLFIVSIVASHVVLIFRSIGELECDGFHLKRLTAVQIKKAEEGHMTPEIENMDSIRMNNSDPLPPRKFTGIAAEQVCQYKETDCVPPFATIRCHIVTVPKYHLSTCLVFKSMSTVMSMSICYLLRDEEFVRSGRSILRHSWDVGYCLHNNAFPNVDYMMQRLRIHDLSHWRLTMVTREPTDRFLSAFIDRCIRVRDPCFGCGNNMTCFLEAEYQRAKDYAHAERLNLSKTKPTEEDKHVFPQSWHCSLQKYSNNYDFIRYSRDPNGTFLRDLNRVLRDQGVPESSINYISTSVQSGRTVHSTAMSSSRAFLEQRLLSSPYLMELIVRLFYYDYKVLGYPFPDLDNAVSRNSDPF
ncbi:hypothetical protein Y032_0002g964 [Ancylostoma ceylanicum]|uniref:Carbohydrate sulfotransferase n=1 Tax=Ancylostoma ceylanicum TaxID=53326 RepID=A0A016W416_9BILA|nr:hypothetical protein Y032_0002g964 [Ancylostoma ceylanicum]